MPCRPSSAVLLIAGTLAACMGNEPVTSPLDLPVKVSSANGDTPVTAIIADAAPGTAPSLQIRSDGLGNYQNASTLTSVIQSVGAWVLDSRNPRNGSRRLFLEFSQPITGSGPGGGAPIAVPSGLYLVRAISKCNLLGSSLLTLAPGASMPCPLHVGFDYGGGSYALQMNPGASAGDPEGNAPETEYATITCTSPLSGSGPCVQWVITPSGTFTAGDGSVGQRNVARLLKYVTSKGKTVATNQGDFYLSFRITVSNP